LSKTKYFKSEIEPFRIAQQQQQQQQQQLLLSTESQLYKGVVSEYMHQLSFQEFSKQVFLAIHFFNSYYFVVVALLQTNIVKLSNNEL